MAACQTHQNVLHTFPNTLQRYLKNYLVGKDLPTLPINLLGCHQYHHLMNFQSGASFSNQVPAIHTDCHSHQTLYKPLLRLLIENVKLPNPATASLLPADDNFAHFERDPLKKSVFLHQNQVQLPLSKDWSAD